MIKYIKGYFNKKLKKKILGVNDRYLYSASASFKHSKGIEIVGYSGSKEHIKKLYNLDLKYREVVMELYPTLTLDFYPEES